MAVWGHRSWPGVDFTTKGSREQRHLSPRAGSASEPLYGLGLPWALDIPGVLARGEP